MTLSVEALRTMMRIRAFETALAARPDHGFQLLSSGEEAVAVGLCANLRGHDQLLTGGRSIGAALARGLAPGKLMAELLGKSVGVNRGRAGRGHLSDPKAGFFGAHAVVGGNISIAAGVALAKQHDNDSGIVAVMFGDGACGQGALHETLNIAASWKLPLLFVCNNNQLSVATARRDALAPAQLSDIGATFGLPSRTVDGLDVETVFDAIAEAAAFVRTGHGPAFVECVSIRLRSHSTTVRDTRKRDELEELRSRCPIKRFIARLEIDAAAVNALEREAADFAAAAVAFADASSYPDPAEVLLDVG
jgi:TPP-dependent pyruvate/acetoin dehydrogenase alpha subunit